MSMESLCDLLFEVSNEDRLSILRLLLGEAMTITAISRELGITTQEASRHTSRLGEVGLTEKDPEGNHHLTPYGRLTLEQIRGVEFTASHKDYFRSRTMADLPASFVLSLGELAEGQYVDDVMVVVHNVEKLIREAEEYIWDVNVPYISSSFPYISSSFPYIKDAFERGVEGRFLHGEDLSLPAAMTDDRRRVFEEDFITKMRGAGLYKERLLDIGLVLYMSEKEVALLSFPQREGRYDFYGFTTTDEAAHKWCGDLFMHYWETASPVS